MGLTNTNIDTDAYSINLLLNTEDELVLDVDDLFGILDQLRAIANGWTNKFTWFDKEEMYEWVNN